MKSNQDVTAGNSGQMRWSQLVDKLVANRLRLECKEIEVAEYSQTYKDLIAELAKEIKSNPYEEQSESYPNGWVHAMVHYNPKSGELHTDGDHSIRQYLSWDSPDSPEPERDRRLSDD